MRRLATFSLLVLTLAAAGCSPRLSPPYRDFEVRDGSAAGDTSLSVRLSAAAVEAGWALAPSPTPSVVATEARRVATGVFSRTTASVELVPLHGRFVRVWVRGESHSALGGRTKVFALTPTLRARVLGPLSEALASRGLVALDTPRDRDEEVTEE